ncbi:MAG: hypothetical protein AAB358_01665 [Patescibacteria group bacterium]
MAGKKRIRVGRELGNATQKIIEILFEIAQKDGMSKADEVMMRARSVLKKKFLEKNHQGVI